jgi:hypothetical protein
MGIESLRGFSGERNEKVDEISSSSISSMSLQIW